MTGRPLSGDRPAAAGGSTGFIAGLPSASAERLVREAIRIDVPSGAVVYRAEEPPRVLVVVTGLLRLFLRSADGREVTVRYARAGDVAGLAMVLGGPAPLGIEAMIGSSVLALRPETLRAMLASDPAVSRACAEELSRQLYVAFDDLADQAFLDTGQRIARGLLDLAVADGQGRLVASVTQQQLADAVGTVREVVARTLRGWRAEGLLETGRGRIVIRDPAALAARAAGESGSA